MQRRAPRPAPPPPPPTPQAYFIHDDQPGVTSRVNNFEFLRPLVEGLGHPFPRLVLPARLMYRLAWLLECLHRALWPLCDLSRLFILTRAEVLKSSGCAPGVCVNGSSHGMV